MTKTSIEKMKQDIIDLLCSFYFTYESAHVFYLLYAKNYSKPCVEALKIYLENLSKSDNLGQKRKIVSCADFFNLLTNSFKSLEKCLLHSETPSKIPLDVLLEFKEKIQITTSTEKNSLELLISNLLRSIEWDELIEIIHFLSKYGNSTRMSCINEVDDFRKTSILFNPFIEDFIKTILNMCKMKLNFNLSEAYNTLLSHYQKF